METIVAAAIRIRVYDDLREKMFKGERVYPITSPYPPRPRRDMAPSSTPCP